jgi:uncharacterized protein YecT (DUF1311 family)
MTPARLAIPLAGLALALGTTAARALDCTAVTSSIDETICNDKALVSLERWLEDHYRDTLRRLDQHGHDLLIDRQRQWAKDRVSECANLPMAGDQRGKCISKAVHTRRDAIDKEFPAPAKPASAPAGKPFEGQWDDCHRTSTGICGSYSLYQQGSRICGAWSYYATGGYDGRLVWTVDGKAADWRLICGRPGSETSLECAYDGPVQRWEKAAGTMAVPQYICADGSGRYLVDLERSCKEKDDYVKRWHLLDAKEAAKRVGLRKPDGWLRQCLNDAAYPDPSTVQQRP